MRLHASINESVCSQAILSSRMCRVCGRNHKEGAHSLSRQCSSLPKQLVNEPVTSAQPKEDAIEVPCLQEVEASMEAQSLGYAAFESLGINSTEAKTESAFFRLKKWILESKAAEKVHTKILQDQASFCSD